MNENKPANPLSIGANLQRFQYLSDVNNPSTYGLEQDVKLHILFLADDKHPANVVQDHIKSILSHSQNRITLINTRNQTSQIFPHSDIFDVILIHYSIYILADTYLSEEWKYFIRKFSGIKAVIREDEYQHVNKFKEIIIELGIQVIFSNLDSPETLEAVYGGDDLSKIRCFSCLPGYIADNYLNFNPPDIKDRNLDIIYRGRILPPQLGKHAQDKLIIGEQVARLAKKNGLKVDISSNESDRIYGDAWPRFLMSGRTMLGVEGGASIFDFDSNLAKEVDLYRLNNPDADFNQIWSVILSRHEGNVKFRTITPKFFEAIAAKTALVLYPGKYNGILEPERNYIVLERDESNFSEVVNKIRNLEYLQKLVDRNYAEILSRKELTMSYYVEQISNVLSILHQQNISGDSLSNACRHELIVTQFSLATTQYQLATTRQELSSIRDEFATTRQELSSIRDEFAMTRQELSSIRDEFATTRQELSSIRDEFATTRQDSSTAQDKVNQLAAKYETINKRIMSEDYFNEFISKITRIIIKRIFRINK